MSRPNALVGVAGDLPRVGVKNRARMAAYLIRGRSLIAEAPVNARGAFRFHLASDIAAAPDAAVVLGPRGLDAMALAGRPDLPRLGLAGAKLGAGGALQVAFDIDDALIDPWWLWCREYTISGSLDTAAGCPVGASVTIYNVVSGVSGLTRYPLATVPTDAKGDFTATFNWCSRTCWWPCWPDWWACWPWWWELDILAVLETVEAQALARTQPLGVAKAPLANVAPLRQPLAADLMAGHGFARAGQLLRPDPARTAQIAARLANPAVRELFPWWWWCCENPNIVFSATQGATSVLDETPATATRWCFASGQSVALAANNAAVGACPVSGGGPCAFAWSSVGDMPGGTLVGDITLGYANGGGACANLAFDGLLYLNGDFAGDCVAFYQVLAGPWGGDGDPARGGTPPISAAPISVPALVNYVSIWRNAGGTVEVDPVLMGPFSFNGHDDLYATVAARQAGGLDPAIIAQIGAFPTLAAGDFVIGWSTTTNILNVDAGALIAPDTARATTLFVQPFDLTGNPVAPPAIDLGPSLTLMIDTTAATGKIDGVVVYNGDGTLAAQTSASSTACPAYQITTPGGGYALVHVTVSDAEAHLCQYYIQTEYGHGSYAPPSPADRDYAQPAASFTPPAPPGQRYGVEAGYAGPNAGAPPPQPATPNMPALPPMPVSASPPTPLPTSTWSFAGGGDTIYVPIDQSCCYDFQLFVSKRTTTGMASCIAYQADFQTVNIAVASA